MNNVQNNTELVWQMFAATHPMTPAQIDKFKEYAAMLIEWNKLFNITALTSLADIVSYHFSDSLAATPLKQFQQSAIFADVGTGGGFPGIPLKIMFPEKKLYLIEVNQKKIIFLREVIARLNLEEVHIIDQDWRTFLRATDYHIDFFCARASLQPEELVRVLRPSSAYHDAYLVYWAAYTWEPSQEVRSYIVEDGAYEVGDKKRRLIVMHKT